MKKLIVLPFEALAAILATIQNLLASILIIFGIQIPSAQSSSTPLDDGVMSEVTKELTADDPGVAKMSRLVPVASLKTILEYSAAEPDKRNEIKLSHLNPKTQIWLKTLSGDQLASIAKMEAEKVLTVAYKGTKEVEHRATRLHKTPRQKVYMNPETEAKPTNSGAISLSEKNEQKKHALKNKKRRRQPELAIAFGM